MSLLTSSIAPFAIFAALIALHLLFIKKSRLLINIIALYASVVAMMIVPRIPQVQAFLSGSKWAYIIAFAVLFIVVHFILSHSNLDTISARISPSSFAISILYRIAIVGLLFAVIVRYLPTAHRDAFSPLAQMVFMSKMALLVWLVLPLFLAFSYRFRTADGWLE